MCYTIGDVVDFREEGNERARGSQRKTSEESPDSTGQVTGEIPARGTSGKCNREQTTNGLGTGDGETAV